MNVDILARRCFGDGARCVETAASIHSLSLPLMWPCFLSLSSSLFLLLFPCLDNLLPHLTPIPSTPTLISVFVPLTVIASLLSRPFYSSASSLLGRPILLIFVEMLPAFE